jgi:hypothetical protein
VPEGGGGGMLKENAVPDFGGEVGADANGGLGLGLHGCGFFLAGWILGGFLFD